MLLQSGELFVLICHYIIFSKLSFSFLLLLITVSVKNVFSQRKREVSCSRTWTVKQLREHQEQMKAALIPSRATVLLQEKLAWLQGNLISISM